MRKAKEAAKAHHGIHYSTRDLLDHEMVDLSYRFVAGAINFGALNVLTGN